jgi:hypothetical protein
MSEPSRSARVVAADRRVLASLILVAGATIVAAIVSAGAEARSAAAPSNQSPPTISGAAVVGETLTASTGSWTGTPTITFTYAWQRCNGAGASCVPIGASGSTYVVAGADEGSTLRVEVTGTNGEGSASATSAPTAVVTQPTAPVNTAEPVISGSPVEGSTLTTTTGTWTGVGTITYAYQWVRCGADGGLPDGSDCPSISGATGSSYTLTADDVGHRLRVQVTATNAAGSTTATSNASDLVTQSTTTGPPRNTVEPSISGTLIQGRVLFASIGTWSGATPITYSYQWVRCGADGGLADGSNCTFISGATFSTYVLSSDDVGSRMRIRITASNSLGVETVASNATAAVASVSTPSTPPPPPPTAPANTRVPSIIGTPSVGQTLFVSLGTWTGTSLIYTYQWLRCGADGGSTGGSNCPTITGATSSSYLPTTGDVGRRLRVQVTARNTLGSATATSEPTALVQTGGGTGTPASGLPAGAVTLSGGKVSIPVSSVSLPARLLIDQVEFTPNPVRRRDAMLTLRVHVVDTRGYAVRDALVFTRSTPLVTSAPGEQRTARDGWVTLRMKPLARFPHQRGRNVQFWIRVRKQGDTELLGGVSNRRLVQVATSAG